MSEYKPIIWYKSEFAWLLISLGWQLFWFLLIGQLFVPESWVWIPLIGTAYATYFLIKGVIYAWIINPKQWYIKKMETITQFFYYKKS